MKNRTLWQQRLKKMIEDSFGKNPLDGYSYYNAEKPLDRVKRFHHAICGVEGHKWEVDDITWNNLIEDISNVTGFNHYVIGSYLGWRLFSNAGINHALKAVR